MVCILRSTVIGTVCPPTWDRKSGSRTVSPSSLTGLKNRAQICKCLGAQEPIPGIDSAGLCSLAARAGTSKRVVVPTPPAWESILGLLV